MHRFGSIVLFVSVAPGVLAQTAGSIAPEEEVSACLQSRTIVNFSTVGIGERIASQLFERIGVRLQWSCAGVARARRAKTDDSGNTILIQVKSDALDKTHQGALAYALPYASDGVRITVLYDRLEPVLETRAVSAGAIFGSVLAHEIGHVLSAVATHRDRGIMRGFWTSEDFASIQTRSFEFTQEDAEFIRGNLKRRFLRRVP